MIKLIIKALSLPEFWENMFEEPNPAAIVMLLLAIFAIVCVFISLGWFLASTEAIALLLIYQADKFLADNAKKSGS